MRRKIFGMVRDHPRRCGENKDPIPESKLGTGSPPQVRGKLSCDGTSSTIPGITPAGAGKTERQSKRPRPPEDHPRRCGENTRFATENWVVAGSPPQVRGKPMIIIAGVFCPRITPAGAGKTLLLPLKLSACRDHPRRCGENTAIIPPITATRGSPPQVRGKRGGGGGEAFLPRITPAGAGKTCLSVQLCPTRQDHPRRCGENMSVAKGLNAGAGSPPQVRGKQKMSRTRNYATRITPAGAGKTKHSHNTWSGNRDHPRRCGENACKED